MEVTRKEYDWSQYRRNRLLLIISIGGTAIISTQIGNLPLLPQITVMVILLSVWIAPLAVVFSLTKCPKCNKSIHLNGGTGYPFSPNCLNCGVRIGQTSETDAGPENRSA